MGSLATAALHIAGSVRIGGKTLSEPETVQRAINKEWKSIQRDKENHQRQTMASLQEVWRQWEELALQNFDRNTRSLERANADKPSTITVQQILNLVEAREITGSVMKKDIVRVIREGFRRGAFNAGYSEFEFNTQQQLVQQAISTVLAKTKGISDTTVSELGAEISNAVSKGASQSTVRRIIRQYFEDSSDRRIAMISQTMTNTAYESGQMAAFLKAGITRKKWLSQRDGRVRLTHWNADGQVVGVRTEFAVGTTELMHPCDPTGPANEVINCRCSMLPAGDQPDEEDEEEITPSQVDQIGKNVNREIKERFELNQRFLEEADQFFDDPVNAEFISGGSHYKDSSNTVKLSNKGTFERHVYHEYGHALHYKRKVLTNNPFGPDKEADFKAAQLHSAIKSKYKKARKAVGFRTDKIKNIDQALYKYKNDNWSNLSEDDRDQLLMFADAINALSNGSKGYGHERSYWRKSKTNKWKEFFAHAMELRYSQNKYYRKFAPELETVMRDEMNDIFERFKDL